MAVLWCKFCGALMGLCQPFEDWSVDHQGLCTACAEKLGTPQETDVKVERKNEGDGTT